MSLRLTLLLAFTCCCGASVRAQEAATPPAQVVTIDIAIDPLADDLAKYGVLCERTFFDELFFNTNQKIEAASADKGEKPDPRLFYFRGLASYQLGWFAESKADLTKAQEAGIISLPGGYGTALTLEAIEQQTPLLPPNTQEIRQGNQVIARVHYFGMKNGAASVLALLPQAYRISRDMFGSEVPATTVLVFDTFEQFSAYDKAAAGGHTSGQLGLGAGGRRRGHYLSAKSPRQIGFARRP